MKVQDQVSDQYFDSRPEEARINAIISPQSEEVSDRQYLQDLQERFNKDLRSGQREIIRPQYWGGYMLRPDRIEFWQGRKGRLHDRILYSKKDSEWQISRLAP